MSFLKIASITADNASNVFAAFYTKGESELSQTKSSLAQEFDEETDDEDEDYASNEIYLSESEDDQYMSDTENEEYDEEVQNILEFMVLGGITRNSCLAHLLQLAIRDALKANETIEKLSKRISKIVNFFYKSPKWYGKFRILAGIGLVKPCATRWNALYDCFNRILNEKVSFNFLNDKRVCLKFIFTILRSHLQ
jgi:hypothetical protein